MTAFALALVLSSAVAHATWNLFAKRARGGVPFLWLALTLAIPLYAPVAIAVLILTGPRIGPLELLWMLGSAALNVAYFIFLQRGYRAGDLSVVYPLARGTGPVLATIAAILIFGERPTPLALAGAVSIAIGVFVLTGDPRKLRQRGVGAAVGYALLTGVTIAAYTLWDKRGVSALLIPPVLYEWTSNIGRSLILAPLALRRWPEVRAEWAANRTAAVAARVHARAHGARDQPGELRRSGAGDRDPVRRAHRRANAGRGGCRTEIDRRGAHGGGRHRARAGLVAPREVRSFDREQPALHIEAARVANERSARSDHPVAGHDDRDRVLVQRSARRA